MPLVPLTRRAPARAARFGGSSGATAETIAQYPVRRLRAGPAPLMGDATAPARPQSDSRYPSSGYEMYEAYYGQQPYHYPASAVGLGAAASDSRYPSAGYLAFEAYHGHEPYHYIAQSQAMGDSIAADVLNAVPGGQDALNYVKQKITDFMALGGQIDTLRQQGDATSTAIAQAGGDTSTISAAVADMQSLRDDYDAVMQQIESIMDVLRQEGILGQLITVAVLTTVVAIAGAMAYVYQKYAGLQSTLATIQSTSLSAAQKTAILTANPPPGGGSITGAISGGVMVIALAIGAMFLMKGRR